MSSRRTAALARRTLRSVRTPSSSPPLVTSVHVLVLRSSVVLSARFCAQGSERARACRDSSASMRRAELARPDSLDCLGKSVSQNSIHDDFGFGEVGAVHCAVDDGSVGPSGPSPAGGVLPPLTISSGVPWYDGRVDSDVEARCDVEARSDYSSSSGHWLRKFSDIPLTVRSRAEAWEVPRDQIKMSSEIGRGTGGVVYRARWRGLDCAAKLLCNSSKVSIEYHDMINEITIISHLRHPNLVLFLGACTINEPLLILSEYMENGSLEDRFDLMRKKLGKPWRPPRQKILKWMTDLSRAVCFLHSCTVPIMHRDLKPSNLLLSEHDHLKVSDFGLCKTLAKVKEDGTPYSMTGCTGTKRYMAPEVVLSKPDYDLKVDVYSMAMIFWYMNKGERPFDQVEPQLISVLASTRGLRPDPKAIHWVPVESLVEQMWAEDPKCRPSCAEILVTLKGLESECDRDGEVKPGFDCNVKCQCLVM